MKRWSLKSRIRIWTTIVLLLLGVLIATEVYTLRHFRSLVYDISRRSQELPAAARLGTSVGALRMQVSEIKGTRMAERHVKNRLEQQLRRMELFDFSRQPTLEAYSLFLKKLSDYRQQLDQYEELIYQRPRAAETGSVLSSELDAIAEIRALLDEIRAVTSHYRWITDDDMIDQVDLRLGEVQSLTESLPSGLHRELAGFSDRVLSQYKYIRVTLISASAASILLTILLIHFAYIWVFRPLRTLVSGSRRVAQGDFDYRIDMATNDEFDELAGALNQMTERFEGIRDDLDDQVRQRSEEVIRSDRLASVGFLAAGVAHEINNPLASIAMSAESLPRRIRGLLDRRKDDGQIAAELAVVQKYVEMIQNEAFRCKGITEKLLDFSRTGRGEKTRAELRGIAESMVEMALTQSRYRHKRIEILPGGPVYAMVNPQEIKQVILNLLTNALDSIGDDGLVTISARRQRDLAIVIVSDNGGGIDAATLENIFEPFFTTKDPGVGTGLGLAIANRIVLGHKGHIYASSPGKGMGASFRIELPVS
ncbi:MAG: HAMP domain-containing protein [Thermoguttaceae bacterium]|nr:HAMP domain-containing protein [Thermoguttaceae bacterium]